ncbi:MAG: nitroreductase family protein [Roseiarcus sp.]|jgi:SagB-type dehydrogenase family enzyme
MTDLVTADSMARAVATDPDIVVPGRPKLCEGLCLVAVRDGLLIEGAAERQYLTGRATVDLLPRLLPALDGRADVEGVARRIDAPVDHVRAAVALLYTRGLLEEGGGPPPRNEADVFLSRATDSTAVNANGAEARARLDRSKALIVGEGRFAADLSDLLRRSGVGDCRLESAAPAVRTLASWAACDGANAIVLVLDAHAAPEVDRLCRRIETPWMWVSRERRELGPVFQGAAGACWRCARLAGVAADDTGVAADEPGIDALILGLAAGNVVHFLSRVGAIPALRFVCRFATGDPRPGAEFVARQSGCPTCCPLPSGEPWSAPRSAALVYEEFVEAAPPDLLNPRAHRIHYVPSNIALQRVEKQRPTLPTIALPAAPSLGGSGAPDAAGNPGGPRLSLGEVALISERIAGLRKSAEGKGTRWAPTGGNLGSVQLYWAVRDVVGLETGLFFYGAAQHRLSILGGAEAYDGFLAALPPRFSEHAAGFLLFTAALNRVSRKYQANAYRLAGLDAGCALGQLRFVARALGFRPSVASRWDEDRIRDLLCAQFGAEPVTAVAALTQEPFA